MTRFPNAVVVMSAAAFAYQASCSTAAPARASLCLPEESVLFQCTIAKKLLSICATQDLSRELGSVFYRFGTPMHIELTYPSHTMHPSKAFGFYFEHWAKGNLHQLSFAIGATTYAISEYSSAFAGNWAGIGIYKQDRRIAKHACAGPTDNTLQNLEEVNLRPASLHRDLLP